MGATIDELQSSLTPSKLVSEAASRAGIADLSWSSALTLRVNVIRFRPPSLDWALHCGRYRRLGIEQEESPDFAFEEIIVNACRFCNQGVSRAR